MMRIFRRFTNRRQQPAPEPIFSGVADVIPTIKPRTCCVCGKAPQVQLIPEPIAIRENEMMSVDDMIAVGTRYEFICYEDLGSFMEVFTDQKIREWTLVRL